MASKKGRFPKEFGIFSKLPFSKIQEINKAAELLVNLYLSNKISEYQSVLGALNSALTKHEVGLLSGLVMAHHKEKTGNLIPREKE